MVLILADPDDDGDGDGDGDVRTGVSAGSALVSRPPGQPAS
ncbi:hypothetical protein ACIPJ1_15645 [Microbacterium maritypicum]